MLDVLNLGGKMRLLTEASRSQEADMQKKVYEEKRYPNDRKSTRLAIIAFRAIRASIQGTCDKPLEQGAKLAIGISVRKTLRNEKASLFLKQYCTRVYMHRVYGGEGVLARYVSRCDIGMHKHGRKTLLSEIDTTIQHLENRVLSFWRRGF